MATTQQLSLWQYEPETASAKLAPRARKGRSSAPGALSALCALEERAQRYEALTHTEGTRASYQADWDAFERWCQDNGQVALPASVETLRHYLTHMAERGLKISTIRHARKSIGLAHAHAGQPRPDQDARIRALERGIGCEHGSREEGVEPLLEHELAQVIATLGHSPRDDRDRAILLLGFAGAFRAADLAGLNMDSLRFNTNGVRVLLARSKEDQLGKGAWTDIPKGEHAATCPVDALRTWIARVGRPAGPLFRVVYGAQIEHQRCSTRAIARAVQRAAARAGLQGHFAAHSLRSGLATSAYAAGSTEREIQVHGRWKDRRSLDRYIDVERLPGRRNVAAGLL